MDVITAIRQLKRTPLMALAAIVTLAVGIGATTAVLTFVGAVMSAATPAADMDRLVGLWSHQRNEADPKGLATPADFLDWSARARTLDVAAAWRSESFNVTGAGTSIRTGAQLVTPEYFRVFGWQPLQGRLFTPDDVRPGAPQVVVLSYAFWQIRLGGQPDVVGQTLKLDGAPATVVGVLPRIPSLTSFFVPLSLAAQRDDRSNRALFVFARLAPGAAVDAARDEMQRLAATLESEFPATNAGRGINVTPLTEEFVGPQARLVFAVLSGMVVIVLLIGCVNIANLLLARGIARRGEFALRLALGAGEWRIVRQLFVESFVLAAAGGLASLGVSRWTSAVLQSLGAVDSDWFASGISLRVLGVTAFISLCAALVAGIAPALAGRRTGLLGVMHGTARSAVGGPRRATQVLVAAQVALAVALLVAAGLGTRTLMALEQLEPGFDIDNVLTASVTLPERTPAAAAAQWVDEVVVRARQLPGVVSAGATSRLPFAGGRWNPNRGLEIEGQATAAPDETRFAVDYFVTPGLIESLRIPLLQGRAFEERDGASAPPVAMVNETMARRYWPGRSPVGARLRQGDDPQAPWRTVVGVVGDVRNDDADQPPLPYIYVPLAQRPGRTFTLALRTTGDPARLTEPLRAAIASFDADQPLFDVRSMRQVWEEDLRGSRILIRVMGALALVALGLAGLGVWGVAASSVAQRTREIGVRVAVGASAARVGAMVAAQGLLPVAAGLSVGLAAGLALGRAMRGILFQVTPADPATVAATVGVLAAVAVLATLGPALRAARLDPLAALRTD